jgi:hypothetical protein
MRSTAGASAGRKKELAIPLNRVRDVVLWMPLTAGLLAALAACQTAPPPKPAAAPITVETHTVEKVHPGCGDHGNKTGACVSFRAVWPEFHGGNAAAVAKLNSAVLGALGFPAGPSAVEAYGPELIASWRVEHRGLVYDDSTWFERRAVEVLARRPGVWSLLVLRTAEIHNQPPAEERSYLNLDPATGEAVTLAALLRPDAAAPFAALAERRLREARGLDAQAALPLKDNRFALPRQYAVTRGGVVLRWTGEELAAAAQDQIELTLKWSDAAELASRERVDPPGAAARNPF